LSAFANKKGGKVINGMDIQVDSTDYCIDMDTLEEMAMLHKLFSSKVRVELLNTFFLYLKNHSTSGNWKKSLGALSRNSI